MQSVTYTASLLTFYLKGEITIEQNFITFKTPHTLLGLIPLGTNAEKIAVDQIASVTSNRRVHLVFLFLSILFWGSAIVGLSDMNRSGSLGALITCLLLGLIFLANAFEYNLVITTSDGLERRMNFLSFEKSKALQLEKALSTMVSNRLNDTNSRQQTDRIIEAINNK